MTIGRVLSEREPRISEQRDLGYVGIRHDREGVSIWVQYPDSFLELVRQAFTRNTSVDLLPKSTRDLQRVGRWRGQRSEFVTAPVVLPYYPKKGDRLKVYSGIRTTGRRSRPTPLFFNAVLSEAEEMCHKRKK